MSRFPPLYECSACGAAVKVVPQGEGREPLKLFRCGHVNAMIWANRSVVLHGDGKLSAGTRIRITLKQFLSYLTGRSV